LFLEAEALQRHLQLSEILVNNTPVEFSAVYKSFLEELPAVQILPVCR
jgi:hypothetical protein